jgi:hypothetical protein
MKANELYALLAGAAGVSLIHESRKVTRLSRHDLATPVAWRAAMRRQMPAGRQPPVYSQEDHDELVRVLFQAIDASKRKSKTSGRRRDC